MPVVERAIAAAARAFVETRRLPAHRRAAICAGISAGIAARKDELAALICRQAKKPIQYARGEVDRASQTFAFAADEARRLGGELVPLDAAPGSEGKIGLVRRVPRGPVAAITPFNFPLNLVAHKIAPALACGASIVVKPAPEAPGPAFVLAELAAAAGAPDGAVGVVDCPVDEAAPLVTDPRLRVLSFTGSAAVGWQLRARAADRQVVLELGGDAAVIVEDDGDWERALPRLVTGAFAYAGQVCISVQRITVHERVAAAFTARFVEAVERLAVVGDPARDDVMVGPLIRTRDADRVASWIDEAVRGGAKILTGGQRDGDTIRPTVLTDVPPDAKLSCEEAFGPVVAICAHRDLDDAIAHVNTSPYGLQAGIYTRDHGKLMRAFAELAVGGVVHDDVPSYRADHMPYGGTKRSGLGREGPRWAIDELTEPRLLVTASGV
jgi:acyl-CoA reductase-like NAD-dependent aldehyde dehydrogenase